MGEFRKSVAESGLFPFSSLDNDFAEIGSLYVLNQGTTVHHMLGLIDVIMMQPLSMSQSWSKMKWTSLRNSIINFLVTRFGYLGVLYTISVYYLYIL